MTMNKNDLIKIRRQLVESMRILREMQKMRREYMLMDIEFNLTTLKECYYGTPEESKEEIEEFITTLTKKLPKN